MKKGNSKTLNGIAIAWMAISLLSGIIRLPADSLAGVLGLQFWAYIVLSAGNLWVAWLVLKEGKKRVDLGVGVVIATYIILEIENGIANHQVEPIGGFIIDAIFPALIVFFLLQGKKDSK